MFDTAYIVRCQRCGVARKSYNDPRRGISVIECKRPCGNSHYDWTFIRSIPATEEWPPEDSSLTDIPLYVPPSRPPLLPRGSSSREASPSPAFPRDEKEGKEVQFRSQGRGSVTRSRSTSAAVRRAEHPPSADVADTKREPSHSASVPECAAEPSKNKKKEKAKKRSKTDSDCFVQ